MKTSLEEINKWLKKLEDINLEFKKAENQFSRDKDLPNYCAALANEGGGKLLLGVDNNGNVVGTKAFDRTYNKLSNELFEKLSLRIDAEELIYESKRILIFHIPSRPLGKPIQSNGQYFMRLGESLRIMDETELKKILSETDPDFSTKIISGLKLGDLDENALENLKKRWAQKSKREDYLTFSNEKMLRSLELLNDKGLNYAALILVGKKEKINEYLPGDEIIFEWRQDPNKTAHDFRTEWRSPFFNIYDQIWEILNARNLRIPFQEGFIQREIFAFNEKAIREALLNAVTHRDYSIGAQSIFIKASPEEFIIESPGGFPNGVTVENVLYKSAWRNRRIAEVLQQAGLVERSGQGMDDIFKFTIGEGKGIPDLSKSDVYSVILRIPGQVKDKNFILFLEKVVNEKQITLSFEEIYELEKVREKLKTNDVKFRDKFIKLNLIENIGKGRGSKYILAHQYYAHEGKTGVHTRLAGTPRLQKKGLILIHLQKNGKGTSQEFQDIFPDLKQREINNLLQELKKEGKIMHIGSRRSGYWTLKN